MGVNWQEIIPPVPLKSKYSIQYVSLKMNENIWRNAEWDVIDIKRQTLKFADGRNGRIEAFVLDEYGNRYELAISSKGDGFDLGILHKRRQFDGPPDTAPDFPTDRSYVKLLIRCDIALQLDKIEWSGYNPK